MRFATALPSAKSALSCDSLHLSFMFLVLVPRWWFDMQGTQKGMAKGMQAHSPKNGPGSQRKRKEPFKRCRDARAVLQQACEVEP